MSFNVRESAEFVVTHVSHGHNYNRYVTLCGYCRKELVRFISRVNSRDQSKLLIPNVPRHCWIKQTGRENNYLHTYQKYLPTYIIIHYFLQNILVS